jgi:hypothetical protein
MESRNNLLKQHLPEIWNIIFYNLNDNDLRSAFAACKYFNELIYKSKLLDRPKWHWVNYEKILSSQTITTQCDLYHYYPLRNGDMAFGLKKNYVDYYNYYCKSDQNRLSTYQNWENHQAILVFCSGMEGPIRLIGHMGYISDIVQHNVNTLASLGSDNTIRIWDKLSGAEKRIIPTEDKTIQPFYLLPLNNEELACISKNGKADVWNIETGECVRELFNFPEQNIFQCTQRENHLIVQHNQNTKSSFKLEYDSNFTVWDIKNEKVVMTIRLADIKPKLIDLLETLHNEKNTLNFKYAVKSAVKYIDYKHGIAIITQGGVYYAYDTINTKALFCSGISSSVFNFQHKFLNNENLVLLYHTPDNWHVVLFQYCAQAKEFKIRHSEVDKRNELISKDTLIFIAKDGSTLPKGIEYILNNWLILSNGNIITHHWRQWCLSSQDYLPEFQLETPSIKFNKIKAKYICTLRCLPNGDILACRNNGVIAIWNGETGKLLLNEQLPDVINNRLECTDISQNGDLYLKWRDNEPHFPDSFNLACPCQNTLLRFNLFQNKKHMVIKKNTHDVSNSMNVSSNIHEGKKGFSIHR